MAVPDLLAGQTRATFGVSRIRVDTPERVAILGATVFFVLAILAYLVQFHGSPQPEVFWIPDEAVNRLAAEQIADHGSPSVSLPYEDPEDLLHMLRWYSDGSEARPAYPPLTYYTYGLARRLGPLGYWLPTLLSAAAVGAVAAAGALVLRDRPWWGLTLPLLAFPFSFWLLRPWHGAGFAYAWVAFATLLVALWSRSGRDRYFAGAAACAAIAGAARPEQFVYLFGALWLFGLIVAPRSWRRVTATLVVAGLGGLALTALLNWAVTGDPLQAGYQELADRGSMGLDVRARDRLPFPLREMAFALAPWGIRLGHGLAAMFVRYWVLISLVGILTLFGATGYVRLLLRSRRAALPLAALVGTGLLTLLYVTTRYCPGCFGSSATFPLLDHSVVRYFAPAYLLVALAALSVLGSRSIVLRRAAIVGLAAMVFLGALTLGFYSVVDGRLFAREERLRDELLSVLPEHAVVYSWFWERRLWNEPSVQIAAVPSPLRASAAEELDKPWDEVVPQDQLARLASSMVRAYEAGYPVVILDVRPEHAAQLHLLLRQEGFGLVPAWWRSHSWVLEKATPTSRLR